MLPGSDRHRQRRRGRAAGAVVPRDRGPVHRAAGGAAHPRGCVLVRADELASASSACATRYGFRPLCLGRLGPADAPEGWVLASETPALSVIGATFVREVAPGEMVVIDADGPRSLEIPWLREVEPRLCIFEFAYIARPDSRLYGREVHETRCRMGELLAIQAPAEADMVMGVPESGVPAAEGFARASGIPYGQGLVKNRYIGRSFIAPDQQAAGRRGPAQAQPAHRRHRRQAARGGGRLHRARHHAALGHPHAARGRRRRGAPAHLVAALALALLLRDRHAVARGAAGDRPQRRGDGRDPRRRLAGLHHASRT